MQQLADQIAGSKPAADYATRKSQEHVAVGWYLCWVTLVHL